MNFRDLTVLMWAGKLDSPSQLERRQAGVAICQLMGVADAIRGISADGEMNVPPAWPLYDIVPVGGAHGVLVCKVRTTVGGGRVEEEVRIPLRGRDGVGQDAIADAADRGRHALAARLDAWVVGT